MVVACCADGRRIGSCACTPLQFVAVRRACASHIDSCSAAWADGQRAAHLPSLRRHIHCDLRRVGACAVVGFERVGGGAHRRNVVRQRVASNDAAIVAPNVAHTFDFWRCGTERNGLSSTHIDGFGQNFAIGDGLQRNGFGRGFHDDFLLFRLRTDVFHMFGKAVAYLDAIGGGVGFCGRHYEYGVGRECVGRTCFVPNDVVAFVYLHAVKAQHGERHRIAHADGERIDIAQTAIFGRCYHHDFGYRHGANSACNQACAARYHIFDGERVGGGVFWHYVHIFVVVGVGYLGVLLLRIPAIFEQCAVDLLGVEPQRLVGANGVVRIERIVANYHTDRQVRQCAHFDGRLQPFGDGLAVADFALHYHIVGVGGVADAVGGRFGIVDERLCVRTDRFAIAIPLEIEVFGTVCVARNDGKHSGIASAEYRVGIECGTQFYIGQFVHGNGDRIWFHAERGGVGNMADVGGRFYWAYFQFKYRCVGWGNPATVRLPTEGVSVGSVWRQHIATNHGRIAYAERVAVGSGGCFGQRIHRNRVAHGIALAAKQVPCHNPEGAVAVECCTNELRLFACVPLIFVAAAGYQVDAVALADNRRRYYRRCGFLHHIHMNGFGECAALRLVAYHNHIVGAVGWCGVHHRVGIFAIDNVRTRPFGPVVRFVQHIFEPNGVAFADGE